jgi:uncharacterized membrane protein
LPSLAWISPIANAAAIPNGNLLKEGRLQEIWSSDRLGNFRELGRIAKKDESVTHEGKQFVTARFSLMVVIR